LSSCRTSKSIYKVDYNFLTYAVIILTNAINIVPEQIFFKCYLT
jgi:hypothetical protein